MGRPAKKKIITNRMRLKDIVSMLADVIYILCDGNKNDTLVLIKRLTDITDEELAFFNIIYPK